MLRFTFINVGFGEAVLLEYAYDGGHFTALIDGGSARAAEYFGPGRVSVDEYLRSSWIQKIDLLICTHFHQDHVGGLLKAARVCKMDEFWRPCENFPSAAVSPGIAENDSQRNCIDGMNLYIDLLSHLKENGCKITPQCGIKEKIPLRKGLLVDILGPERERCEKLQRYLAVVEASETDSGKRRSIGEMDAWLNQSSMILRFHYAGRKILLPSDVSKSGISYLFARPELLSADVLKIAHHGIPDCMDGELARYISPSVAVTCTSSDRRYGSADSAVYDFLLRENKDLVLGFTDGMGYGEAAPEPRSGFVVEIGADGAIGTGVKL